MSEGHDVGAAVPRIVVLYCQHSVADSSGIDIEAEEVDGISLRAVMLNCSSKVQVPFLLKILDEGADGLELVACPEKACRFLTGSRKCTFSGQMELFS